MNPAPNSFYLVSRSRYDEVWYMTPCGEGNKVATVTKTGAGTSLLDMAVEWHVVPSMSMIVRVGELYKAIASNP